MPRQTRQVPFLLVLALFSFAACLPVNRGVEELRERLRQPETEEISSEDGFLPFGNPSGAGRQNRDNYLLVKRSHVLSYNNSRGTANWAAWRTAAGDLAESIPRPQFAPDPTLPADFELIEPRHYFGSGYDRGHLLPSADRFSDAAANAETFLMSNIVPQAGGLNQYPWKKLERYARGIARRGRDVYTIAGAYGEKGRLAKRVTVPTNCWKIIIVLPLAGGSNKVDASTRVIAVDMPNENRIDSDRWQKYLTTVSVIEQKTGHDFFSVLPRELQDVLETRIAENDLR